jgi:hypothetical protein
MDEKLGKAALGQRLEVVLVEDGVDLENLGTTFGGFDLLKARLQQNTRQLRCKSSRRRSAPVSAQKRCNFRSY